MIPIQPIQQQRSAAQSHSPATLPLIGYYSYFQHQISPLANYWQNPHLATSLNMNDNYYCLYNSNNERRLKFGTTVPTCYRNIDDADKNAIIMTPQQQEQYRKFKMIGGNPYTLNDNSNYVRYYYSPPVVPNNLSITGQNIQNNTSLFRDPYPDMQNNIKSMNNEEITEQPYSNDRFTNHNLNDNINPPTNNNNSQPIQTQLFTLKNRNSLNAINSSSIINAPKVTVLNMKYNKNQDMMAICCSDGTISIYNKKTSTPNNNKNTNSNSTINNINHHNHNLSQSHVYLPEEEDNSPYIPGLLNPHHSANSNNNSPLTNKDNTNSLWKLHSMIEHSSKAYKIEWVQTDMIIYGLTDGTIRINQYITANKIINHTCKAEPQTYKNHYEYNNENMFEMYMSNSGGDQQSPYNTDGNTNTGINRWVEMHKQYNQAIANFILPFNTNNSNGDIIFMYITVEGIIQLKQLRLTNNITELKCYHIYFHAVANINTHILYSSKTEKQNQIARQSDREQRQNSINRIQENYKLLIKQNILDGFVVPHCLTITNTHQQEIKLVAIGCNNYQAGIRMLQDITKHAQTTINQKLRNTIKQHPFKAEGKLVNTIQLCIVQSHPNSNSDTNNNNSFNNNKHYSIHKYPLSLGQQKQTINDISWAQSVGRSYHLLAVATDYNTKIYQVKFESVSYHNSNAYDQQFSMTNKNKKIDNIKITILKQIVLLADHKCTRINWNLFGNFISLSYQEQYQACNLYQDQKNKKVVNKTTIYFSARRGKWVNYKTIP